MAWIEVHQTLTRHPKLLRLSAKLRIHRAQSAGHLLSLWLWTVDYAPTGDLSAFGPAEISDAADYPGDAESFAQALRDTGWIDPDGRLHDWMEYAGRLVEKREMNRERMKEARAAHVQRTCNARAGATIPNRTIPNRTENKTVRAAARFVPPTLDEVRAYCAEKGNSVDPETWWNFYAAKGWMVGKNKMVKWKAAIATWEKGNRNGQSGNRGGNSRPYESAGEKLERANAAFLRDLEARRGGGCDQTDLYLGEEAATGEGLRYPAVGN